MFNVQKNQIPIYNIGKYYINSEWKKKYYSKIY